MTKFFAVIPLVFVAACSEPDGGKLADRYQFLGGSNQSIDFVFDRVTGCISEIKRSPNMAEFNEGTPVFDPTKPFTTEEVPDWAKPTPAEKAAEKTKAKPSAPTSVAQAGELEFHGAVESFENWRCPPPATAKADGSKK